VVDLREPEEFWQYQLPASINVPLSMGQFGANVASFVDISSPVVLLVNNENEARMAQVALGVVGRYELEGFVTAAEASRLLVKADYMRIEPEHLHKLLELESVAVLDVRQPAEFEQDSLPGAINLPLAQLPGRLSELEAFKDSLLVVTCAAGYRSSLASSFLTQQGWGYIQNLKGGMNGFNSWNRTDRQAA
ncbi:MAG TPA: rhodanese-like domain-containing protein, partial [Chloroflexia bacterium]|nr:rhodanese-like domain-containing protein [Chloroflexia bacterium]